MDRRQKKTRESIFKAFTFLLSKKHYSQISVQDIIDEADIGRTTFYAHFETKDYLLKALCEELFGHIVDTAMGISKDHYHSCKAKTDDSVFLHLFSHLLENDNNILELLSSQSREIFLGYFKSNLKTLIKTEYISKNNFSFSEIPESYLINHICSSFVESVDWWLCGGMKYTPCEMTEFFLSTIEPLMIKLK